MWRRYYTGGENNENFPGQKVLRFVNVKLIVIANL